MNQQEALRRIQKLEVQARVTKFEHAVLDPELREVAERYAREADVTVEALLDECAEISRRIDEIGEAAWERESADRYGITVEQFRQNGRLMVRHVLGRGDRSRMREPHNRRMPESAISADFPPHERRYSRS